jgi:heme/copper-type cytochrome/quinol oxidase subunit 2
MKALLTWRKILGLVGLLILGGMGSSLSDQIFKPLIVSVSDVLLNFATLGISSVRDGMYADIAKNYERTGSALLAAFIGILLGITTVLIALVLMSVTDRFSNKMKEWLSTHDAPSLRSFVYGWAVIMILLTGFMTITMVRVIYTVNAASYLDQLQKIVSPKLSTADQLEFQSRAAQISTRAEYVQVVGELKHIADTNKLRVPDFDIFF